MYTHVLHPIPVWEKACTWKKKRDAFWYSHVPHQRKLHTSSRRMHTRRETRSFIHTSRNTYECISIYMCVHVSQNSKHTRLDLLERRCCSTHSDTETNAMKKHNDPELHACAMVKAKLVSNRGLHRSTLTAQLVKVQCHRKCEGRHYPKCGLVQHTAS